MKRLAFLLVTLIAACTMAFGQTQQPEYITIDKNKLPGDMKQQLETVKNIQETEQKIKQYGEWVGFGAEVGTAIKEGLVAVKDVSIELSESNLGKFTMFLIAYKVIGQDMIRISIGVLLIAISIFLVSRSYFKTFRRRVLIKNPGWFRYPKEYKEVSPTWEYPNAAALMHVLVLVLLIGVAGIIMFA